MADRVPDLRLFRYAMASAEHGSFRRAAEALSVQHSAVSRGVRELEFRVGGELFERSHAGIRPTQVGGEFLDEARQGFDHLERAMRRVDATRRAQQKELTVGAGVPFTLISDIFERFRQHNDAVAFDIVEMTSQECSSRLQQHEIDVAFGAGSFTADGADSLFLGDARLSVVLPRGHRLTKLRAVVLEDVRLEQFILPAGGAGPDIADHLARRLAGSTAAAKIRLHRLGQCDLLKMVGKGFGVTVVLGPLLSSAPDDTVVLPLAGLQVMPLQAVWMAANPNPALKDLLGIVRELALGSKSGSPGGAGTGNDGQ